MAPSKTSKSGPAQNRRSPAATRHEDVTFIFLSMDAVWSPVGGVVCRDDEMVLDLRADGNNPPYVVVGKRVEYFFAGVNTRRDEDATEVVARWALLGDVYAGIWIEEGAEYLFSFRLPKRPARSI